MSSPPSRVELEQRAIEELKVLIPSARWKLDSSCGLCGVVFGYLRSRHHCRNCGLSVCGKHSRQRAVVPSSMSSAKQRVCDMCYPKCQYGIPKQRRRGYTTASSVRINFTIIEDIDSPTGVDQRAERSRSKTLATRQWNRSRQNSQVESGSDQQSIHHATPRRSRRRGESEPPEHIKRKAAEQRRRHRSRSPYRGRSPTSSLKLKPSPRGEHASSHVIPPFRREKTNDMFKAYEYRDSSDVESFTSDLDSVQSLARDTNENDAIALQYLGPKQDLEKVVASRVVVSHHCADVASSASKLIEIPPSSPQKIVTAPSFHASSPTRRAMNKPQNRKTSSSSTGTVSVSYSEDLDEAKRSVEIEDGFVAISRCDSELVLDTSLPMWDDSDSARRRSKWSSEEELRHKDEEYRVSADTSPRCDDSIKPTTLQAQTILPQITEEQCELMREIMELEWQINKHQSELPALLDEWKEVERVARDAHEEMREAREKVRRYEKARAVVARAIRNAAKSVQEKEYEAAVIELMRATAIERTNAKVWFMLAECRLHLRQLAEAEESCRMSLKLQRSAVGVALLGRILQLLGRPDEAIECYLTALGR